MAMTLLEARNRIRLLLDDTDLNPLIVDTRINDTLKVAQAEVWQRIIGHGANLFSQEAAVASTSNGVVDLSTIKPLKINNVQLAYGNTRWQVQPAKLSDYVQLTTGVQQLRINYIPRASFPASDAANFVWSTAAVDAPLLDQLMVMCAAAECWIQSGERPLESLERRKQELKDAVDTTINVPSWVVMPLAAATRYPTSRYAGFQYVIPTTDTMQLVYA